MSISPLYPHPSVNLEQTEDVLCLLRLHRFIWDCPAFRTGDTVSDQVADSRRKETIQGGPKVSRVCATQLDKSVAVFLLLGLQIRALFQSR